MSHGIRTIVAAVLAALVLLAAPVAASNVDETAIATERNGADAAMPSMLRLAVAHSRATDVAPAYHLDRDGRGANPRHGLELAFTPRGARIDGATGGFALHLERFGRGEGRPMRRMAPRIDGAWVEYDRGPGLTEWFVNLPDGVEQGWTVTQRPAGDGNLALELDTARSPRESDDGRLAWSGLVYHRLVALDAHGRELPATWMHDGARLRIEVDDRDATYPVLIDPWVQQGKLVAGGGARNDLLGESVDITADTALIGAPGADVGGNLNQGAAYVFTRSDGEWILQTKVTAADGAADDRFGFFVSLSGDTAVVGSHGSDVDGRVNQGAAYVFTRTDELWNQQAKLTAADGAAGDQFGRSVAVDGDIAVVGAVWADVGGNGDQGAAYVFTRGGGVWSQQAKLTAADGAGSDQLGISVAISGDTALAGAFGADVGDGGATNQGAAYVFTGSGGAWSQQAKLIASDGAEGDNFGRSVAIDDDTALVGAFSDGNNRGSAYVFTRSGELWTQQAKLTAEDAGAGDRFGVSLDLEGDTAVVGASLDNESGNENQGSVYVFNRSGAVWSQQAKIVAADGEFTDQLGVSVAIAGNTLLSGARYANFGPNPDQGAAYVYVGGGGTWNLQDKLVDAGGVAGDLLGRSVDIDGDTAVVGAPGADIAGRPDEGAAYVFTRSGGVWSEQVKLTASDGGLSDQAQFGIAVAVDGDTALVGAHGSEISGTANVGAAYVFTRAGGAWSQQAKIVAPDGGGNAQFGAAVDLEGDTALVGAFGRASSRGRAYVFNRSGGVWSVQDTLLNDDTGRDRFGISVALEGDTAVVGAYLDDVGGNTNQGSALVFTRSGEVWNQVAKLTASDGAANDQFGRAVAIAGDTAVVGSLLSDIGSNANQGAAYVFIRGAGDWTQQAKLVTGAGAAGDQLGFSVAAEGNTALAGASGGSAAYVFTRSGGVWSEEVELTAADGAADDGFGISAALTGGDAIVGAYAADVGDDVNEGAAYVYVLTADPGPGGRALRFTPASLNFGEVEVGSDSAPLTTTLTNTGTAEVTGLTFNPPGDGFSIDASACGTSLPAGGSCAVSVVFTPPEPGFSAATFTADSSEGQTSNPVVLAGNGLDPDGTPEETLVFSPASLNFNDVEVNTESAALVTTLTNIGSEAADGLTFGLPADGFSADTSACGASLPAGASCQVSVTFTPAALGLAIDALQASAVGAISNPVVLTGNGVEADDPDRVLVFDPTSLEFGDVPVGLPGPTLTTTLTNTGAVDATGLAFNVPGVDFSVDTSACGTVLSAGASCEVAITFVPSVLGPVTAALEAGSEEGLTSNFVALYGRGVEDGGGGDLVLTFEPDSLAFGEIIVGTTSTELTATLTNGGGKDATALGFVVSDGDFAADTSACGTALPAGASCDVAIVFGPSENGPVSATLIAVAATQGAVSNPVDLTGSGLPSGPGVPVLTMVPSELDFGNVASGTTSSPLTAVLANSGDVEATGLTFAVSDPAFSADTGGCGGVLAPGASCTISVTFTPPAPGLVSATLQASSAEGSSVQLGVGGNGIDPGPGTPVLELAPASLAFGSISVGSSSPPMTATLTNSGDVDAGELTFAISQGAFSADTSACGEVLVAGESCSIQVVFAPAALGPASATLLAIGGDGVNNVTSNPVGLSGEGATPGPGGKVLRFAPASLNFGEVELGAESVPLSTTLTNTGTVEVTGLVFSTPGDGFAVDASACGTSLPAGGSCDVSVVFTPAAIGVHAATLRADASEGETSNTVVIAGNGVEPGGNPEETLIFSPASLNFDDVEVGTESPVLVTALTNIGDTEATGLAFDLPTDGFTADTSACGSSLPAGASCDVSVTFNPAAVGLAIDALQASAVDAISNSVILAGNGVEPGDPNHVLIFDPTNLDFGDVELGTSGPTLTTTLTNSGDVDATGLAFNSPGSGYTVDTSACGTDLPAGASCTVEITFVPPVLGPVTAALEAGSAEGLTSNFVLLSGRGTDDGGGGEDGPVLVFEPASLDFGSVVVGEESLPLSVTLSNTGNADATALGFVISDGAFAADISACGTSLQAGASCDVSVTFTPSVAAPVGATLLAVAGSQGAVSNPVDLAGVGLPAGPGVPVLTMTPSQLDFGNVEVGSTSPTLTAALANSGDVDATGLAFAVSDPAFSADTSSCGASLPAGASCTISVTFTPPSPGLVGANLEASSGEGATVNLSLSGNGVDLGPGVPVLELAPAGLAFGIVPVDSSSPPLVTTLTNSGDVDAEGLTFAISDGDFSADTSACGTVLAAGASCDVSIVFTPSAFGPVSATLVALAGDGVEGVTSNPVDMNGIGGPSGPQENILHFLPASLNFGDVEVGTDSSSLTTTLINGGATEVTGLTFSAPGNGFAIDSSACGAGLPAGGSCDVGVVFTPAAAGFVVASLQADGDGGLTSNAVVLAGNGVEPGEQPEETLVFSPAALNFDNVVVGTESPSLVTTMTNIGDTEASGLTFDLPVAEFAVDTSACGASLPAGASCDVSIAFTPATLGLTIDSLQASAVGVISNPVVLAGNGIDADDPDLVLVFDPTGLDFGAVELGTSGPTLTTTLTNTGDVDATGLAFNTPGSGFGVDSSACGTTLDAGASCTVDITFIPPVLGPVTAALEAGSTEGLTSNFVLLAGRGVEEGGGGGEPVLVFEPASLGFGETPVGTTSAALSTTLTNTGDTDATALGFAVSNGVFAADTSACGTSLSAGASCEVSLTFTPTTVGPVSATLVAIAAAEGVASTPVDLSGSGLPSGPGVPVLTMTPPSLDFGNVTIGSTSPPLTATLANTGDVEATGLVYDVPVGDFTADTSACGVSLPAGASCTIGVTFTPAQAGLADATLQASSAEGSAVNLGLSGNGVDSGPGVPVLELAPASLEFGIIPVGSSSPPLTATLTNSGDVDASGLAFAISNGVFSADTSACGDVLAAGATCDVQLVFTPSVLGPVSTTMVALAEGGTDGVVSNSVGLNGIGTQSGPQDSILVFIPASLNFGDVEVGTESDSLTTTLINGGTTEVTGLTFSTPGNGFSVDGSACGTSLPAGGTCDVLVSFSPAAPGLAAATLRADVSEGVTSNPVVVAGNGVDPDGTPAETLELSPATLNFDNVVVGTESPSLVTTLTNNGDTEAGGLTFDLPTAAEFTVDTGSCGASLPAGASCDVNVTFTPAALGLAIDALQASAVGAISNPVVLAGNGVEADDPNQVLVFDPTALDFGDVELGTSSPTLTTTLTNTGDVDATGLAFNTPGSGFTVDTSACGTGLPAGASCEISITFVPPLLGPVTAALQAGSAEGLASNFVLLSGRGTDDGGGGGDEPELVFEPAALDFGSVVVGEESLPLSVTLSNIGDADATELGFALSNGAFAADTSACGTSLAAGASCDVTVILTPTIAAPVSATLQAVAAAQGVASNPVDLTGIGLPAGPGVPVLTITPAELDFGNVEVGSTSPSLTATLANSGDVEATGLTLEVSDLVFSADTSACGASLPAGASCAITVTFTPAVPGLVNANLQASSAEGTAVNLGLGGNGIDSGPGVPVLELAPAGLAFGVIPVDSSSPPLVTTLTNSGDVDAEGLDFAISNGVFSADTSACGTVLAAGASCDVSIVFTPAAFGPVSATLVALAGGGDAGVVSNEVGLNGIGGPSGPQGNILHFLPASLNFGDVEVGTESDSLTTTLINGGTTEVTGLTFSTPDNEFTVDSSACGTSLPAGGTCDVHVAFSPAAPGLSAATLQAEASGGLTSNAVVLAGNGVDPDGTPAETLELSPATLNFDDVVVGTESPALVTTLTNTGDTEAGGLSFELPAAEFAVDTSACGASLPAGASCDVSITFTPATLGLAIDALQASAVDAISNPVVLAGNGVDADDPNHVLVFDPTELDFGDVELGTSGATLTTTLTNTGDSDATGLAFNTPGSGFTVDTSACGTSLPAGASCDVTVTFVPPILGPVTAALEAGAAGGQTSNFVVLYGRGVEEGGGGGEPVLAFEPTSLDFGEVPVGATSTPLTATLSNVGDTDANGVGFTLTGESFEADTTVCGPVLPAGESCLLSIVFTPSEIGPADAELTATSDEGATAALALSGVGIGEEGLLPMALAADPQAGALSDGNGVFEPGERVDVAPEWLNDGSSPLFLGGNASDFTGPQGPNYNLVDDSADFGEIAPGESVSCLALGNCYEMEVGPPGVTRPAAHWDTMFEESLSDPDGTVKPWALHIGDSFLDVPRNNIFYSWIETLVHNSVTAGCTSDTYCPSSLNARGQMSVFVLKSVEGPDYQPAACEQDAEMFDDVPFDNLFCPWIEELASRGVVVGCDDESFCPDASVTRAQMSIFLLKTLLGTDYTPPACTGEFIDVPCTNLFADWIEDLAARQITAGCIAEPSQYCPAEPVSRSQMAVFLTKTFGLVLYGP